MSPRRAAVLVAPVAVVALALTGCTGDGSTDESSEVAAPTTSPSEPSEPSLPPRPRVGECRRLTLEDATRPTTGARAVPCRGRHTAVTVHVGRLGADADVETPRVQRRLTEVCARRMADYVGGDAEARTLSRFQVVWFTPTAEEVEAGARWFHCDVLALDRGDRLVRLPPPRRLRNVLDRPDALETFGLCGTAQPGARRFERVACARPHRWVAIGTIPLEGGRRYPGAQAVRRAGDEACADRVRSERGFPLEFDYGWEWPTRAQWESGQRYGFCWAPA